MHPLRPGSDPDRPLARSSSSSPPHRPGRIRVGGPALLPLLVLLASCIHVTNRPPATEPGGDAPDQAAQAKQQADEGPFEDWDEVLEDTRRIDGYFTLHLKRDNTLYLEVPPERLGRDFGLLTHYGRGLGDLSIQEGLPASGGTQLMRIERHGDRLWLIRRNPHFTADPGSAMAAALEENVGHSVAGAFDIESRHEETGHLLVDVTDWLVSDYTNTSTELKEAYGGRPVRLDGDRSRVDRVRGFARNVEIDVLLTYTAEEPPPDGSAGVSDFRSVPVGIRYSIFDLPDDPMRPRPADERVGHFLTAHEDFSRDRAPTRFVRYVNRWRLEKQDHSREVSPPVDPIVYWIDRSVPEEYRPYVRAGIEAWNQAFRAAGYENAVVAKLAPPPAEDSTWSAEDMRYSTVRWTAAHDMGYAIGPSQVDPRTGEILNADILVSSEFVSGWFDEWHELVSRSAGSGAPARPAAASAGPGVDAGGGWIGRPGAGDGVPPAAAPFAPTRLERHLARNEPQTFGRICRAAANKARQLGVQYAVLAARGVIAPGEEMPEEYLGGAIKDLVMHEVGHTLGLRHNFKASSGIPYDRLHDRQYTGEHGVSLSVMDYAPVNLAVDPERQGHYWNPEVGTYDVWAIRYAYAPVYRQGPDEPFASTGTPVTSGRAAADALEKIADESAEPLHTYATDEDARLGPWVVDPLANTSDLGSDPLEYARDRGRVVRRVASRLEDRIVAEGDGWHRLRDAYTSLLFDRLISLLPVTHSVGGMYVSRDHRGQPDARPPFRSVPAERQRAAVDLIAEEAFSEGAVPIDPATLNRLAPDMWSHWGRGYFRTPIDYPIHDWVLTLQEALLSNLTHPARLARMVDNQARTPQGEDAYRVSELLGRLTEAIWSELETPRSPRPIDSFRRNLQRAHLDDLQALVLAGLHGPLELEVPEDARSLARAELRRIRARIDGALGADAGPGAETRAHLQESRARIDRTLEAGLVLPYGAGG